MDRTEGVEKSTDWEQALHLYEEVISSKTEDLQIRATIKLGRLSNKVPENVLARTVPILIEFLGSPLSISTLSNNSSLSIQEAATYCLNCIARRGEGELAVVIGQSGAIPFILKLLRQSEGSRFRKLLIKCLWRIVNSSSLNRVMVARNGGLEVVLNLFGSCNKDDTRLYLLEILSSLVLLKEVRRVVINLGGLPLVVESAKCGSMVSRARAAQAIGLLGVTRRVRRILVDLGIIPVLIELLRDGDISTKLIAGNALGIIASHIDYLRPVAQAGAIPLYANLLLGPEPLGKEIVEDVFCILAVAEVNAVSIVEHLVRILKGDNDDAKAAAADVLWDLSGYKHSVPIIRNSGAISVLVELLKGDNDDAKAAAADVLWDLSGYKHSVPIIRNSGAISVLVELLKDGNDDVREKVSGAVAQLSYDEVDRRALADAGVIPLLINLLQDNSEDLKDNAAETLINFSEDPLLRDRVSEAFDIPSFQNIQNRLVRNRSSDEHMLRSLRQMSIEQFTWDPNLA